MTDGIKSYTPKEVAELLGVSVFTIQELLREGRIKGYKLTTRWRVSHEELENFIKNQNEEEEQ